MKEIIKKIIVKMLPGLSRKEQCENEIKVLKDEITVIDNAAKLNSTYKGIPDSEICNGIVTLDLVRLAKRFDFLGINKVTREIFIHLCYGLCRAEIINLGIWKKNAVNGHFTRTKLRIGQMEDYEIKERLLCSDDDYTRLYLVNIEYNRNQIDISYKMKKHL